MISDTINAIKEAEEKARLIVEEAQKESASIREKAGQDGALYVEECVKKARDEAGAEMDALKKECGALGEAEAGELEKEIEAIKALAATKEDSAVSMIIDHLLP